MKELNTSIQSKCGQKLGKTIFLSSSTHSGQGAADSGAWVVAAICTERILMNAKMNPEALGFRMSTKSNRESG